MLYCLNCVSSKSFVPQTRYSVISRFHSLGLFKHSVISIFLNFELLKQILVSVIQVFEYNVHYSEVYDREDESRTAKNYAQSALQKTWKSKFF